jgi:hypothetical protein
MLAAFTEVLTAVAALPSGHMIAALCVALLAICTSILAVLLHELRARARQLDKTKAAR